MKSKEKTFQLTISGTDGNEWQGTLGLPGGGAVPFRSTLELLKEIHTQIQSADRHA